MDNKKKIALAVFAGILLYFAIIVSQEKEIVPTLLNFNWKYAPIIISLTFANYFFRFVKWHFYLRELEIKIPVKSSALIFLSGLSMSITPAKIGETFKAYLLKEKHGTEATKTLPVVAAERITDIAGLAVLALIGSLFFSYGTGIIAILLVAFLAFSALVWTKNINIANIVSKIPLISKYSVMLDKSYGNFSKIFSPKNLAITTGLSILSWMFECLAFFTVLTSFGLQAPVLFTIFAFSFTTILGAISMIPGGLGVTEFSLIGLLIAFGIAGSGAAAATILIRIFTLWLGVAVGLIAFLTLEMRSKSKRVQ
jgi:glycosyltransferase 2 family protein